MTIPVHSALAPADGGYDEIEVGPWPHIHLVPDSDDGTVGVQLLRYKGQHSCDRESRDRLAEWRIDVAPPGRFARSFGDTLDGRIDRAIARLERRWADHVAAADAAYVAAAKVRR